MLQRLVWCVACCCPLLAWGDSIDTSALFGDSYQGYLVNEANYYWADALTVKSYSAADLSTAVGELELNPVCLEGSGADCTPGVLFKKSSVDAAGNKFYLVHQNDQSDVWIQDNEAKSHVFNNEVLTRGGELIYAEDFELTDTSREDAVPDLNDEQRLKLDEIAQKLGPEFGRAQIAIPSEAKSLRVKGSYLAPEGEFMEYPLSTESAYFRRDENQFFITSTAFKRKDKFLAISLLTIPGLKVNNFEFMEESSYVWLDTSGLNVKVEGLTPAQFREYLLSKGEAYSVQELKEFNGRQYAMVVQQLTLDSPFDEPDEQGVKKKIYSIPYKWIKIRDDQQRLRFWFDLFVSC